MKQPNIKIHIKSFVVLLVVCFGLSFLFACSSGPDTFDKPNEAFSDTGSIIFSLQWEHPVPASALRALSPSGNVCVDYGIETISAYVYNNPNTRIASGNWPCSAGQGRISNISPGTNMRIMIEGSVSGKVFWRGEKTGISVFTGQITNVGIVTMNYVGEDHIPPLAPIDLSVDPNNWSNSNFFHIDWTNPNDQTVIAGAYYKLGSAPESQSDANYTTDKPFTVSVTAEGGQVIYVWLQDGANNADPNNYSLATLLYDASSPIDGNISVIEGDRQISLSWSGFSDTGSGINQYVLSYSTSGYPSSCGDPNSIIYSGTNNFYMHTNLENGTTYHYRICAIDNANNVSNGVTASGIPQPPPVNDQTPPPAPIDLTVDPNTWTDINSFHIDWTNPNDQSGIAGTYYTLGSPPVLQNDGNYTTDKPFTVAATAEGGENIYIWLMDGADNADPNNYSLATLYYDSTAPIDGNISVIEGDRQISLNWSGFSDTASGINQYVLSYSTSGYPSSCGDPNATIHFDPNTHYLHTNLENGTTYYYRICAIDNVNNVSNGVTASGMPQPPPPTDYYVDANKGSNSTGDGTESNPWMTISFALSQLNGPGMTIHIAAGTYDTDIDGTWSEVFPIYLKDGVSLKGENRDTTIIDAEKSNIIMTGTGIGSSTSVEGFTFKNGKHNHSSDSGGITLSNASPTIKNNIFEYNEGLSEGGAISVFGDSSPSILNNIFRNNINEYKGTIYIDLGSPLIGENLFMGNSAGTTNVEAAVYIESGTAFIRNNLFINNSTYGAITIGGGSNTCIMNNTIIGTDYDSSGSGIIISGGTGTKILNNIIAENTGYGIEEKDASYDPNKVEYNLFYNNSSHYLDEGSNTYTTVLPMDAMIPESANNLEADPLFVDQANDDYHLQSGSPAINTGTNNNAPDTDMDGDGRPQDGIVDIGADETELTPPENIIVFPGDGMLTIIWDTVSAATQYNIYMSESSGVSKLNYSAKKTETTTYYTWTGLTNGTTYYLVLTSKNSYRESSESDEVSTTPNAQANYYISPDSGIDSSPTDVTIIGEGLQERSAVALYGGGPYITGSCMSESARGVYVQGTYAYVADGHLGLLVMDISDPANPGIVGSCETPNKAFHIFVLGSYAYVSCTGNPPVLPGLQVIDISDPTKPSIVGSCNTPESAFDVFVSGSYAYVALYDLGIQVIDVSDHTNPSIVGSCDTTDAAFNVFVSGSYAYVADYAHGLHVIDISDPTKPGIVETCDTPNYAYDVFVSGSYAYVVACNERPTGLHVIDISDPTKPGIVGSCDTPDYANDVFVSGSYAYVTNQGSGLQVIDISDPNNPTIVNSCNTPDSARDVFVSGPYAYVADQGSGLHVIDVSYLTNPSIVGSCDTPDLAFDVFVSGSYAYVADRFSGLQVIHISDPNNFSIVGSCDTPDYAQGIFVSGDYTYVADSLSGLQVIHISDPTNPTIVGSCDTPNLVNSVFVSGSYAYVTDDSVGLRVIHIIDPTDPVIVGTSETIVAARDVHISGSYAYVADQAIGLKVIDISNPTNPTIVGFCDTPPYLAFDVFVSGPYAYMAGRFSGLHVIDISDPTNPSIVGSCDTPDKALNVFVSDPYAYVADEFSGLQVIDISDPNNPIIVGFCDTPDRARDVFISGPYAYVADWSLGLQVIERFEPLPEITYLDSHIITTSVPSGFRPGTYNLYTINPDGMHNVLHNGFTVYYLP